MTPSGTRADDLSRALERSELFPVFQPQFSAETGLIVAAEALCRWRHAEDGLIPADEFIPLAEETGAIHAIGLFMLDQCFDALDAWRSDGRTLEVSVNVSPLQLLTDDFVDQLADRFAERDLPALAVTIEITETRPVPGSDEIARRLQRLRSLGVGVALDDYGTGHSSRGQLEKLPLSEVKLDRSLVQTPPDDVAPLVDMVAWAHEHGIRVVAEGIETTENLDFARSLASDRMQGYLLGLPVARSAIDGTMAV
ncbi:MAG: EAL domain-containing protein [Microbacterium sp.]